MPDGTASRTKVQRLRYQVACNNSPLVACEAKGNRDSILEFNEPFSASFAMNFVDFFELWGSIALSPAALKSDQCGDSDSSRRTFYDHENIPLYCFISTIRHAECLD